MVGLRDWGPMVQLRVDEIVSVLVHLKFIQSYAPKLPYPLCKITWLVWEINRSNRGSNL